MKTCTKCGEEKPLEAFRKSKLGRNGLRSCCRACDRADDVKRRAPGKERFRLARQALANMTAKSCRMCGQERPIEEFASYGHGHSRRPDCRACMTLLWKRRYRENKDAIKAQMKAWRLQNPERARESQRRWYKANPERVRVSSDKWKRANKEKHRASIARWHKAHPEAVAAKNHRRRARRNNSAVHFRRDDVRAQYALQGGLCFYCKKSLDAKYHVDHRIPLSRGGSNGPENIVCACPSCNVRKNTLTDVEFFARLEMTA